MYLLTDLGTATNGFCSNTASIWQLVGRIMQIFFILIPILILIFGMIDLGKAVVASKDDEIKKAAKSLLMRLIVGLVIFFVPTLVGAVITIVDSFSDVSADYEVCSACIRNPKGGTCTDAVSRSKK